ncbi:DUF3793 family protein [Treponema sp.]|uniref:DUF3793 family protein n=1 Tax=Treponema sp. TaxID=166 RepID=UPI00388DEB25
MSFDETIIHGGAPALCGIKPACLFSMDARNYEENAAQLQKWRAQFAKEKKYLISLKKSDGRFLFFVFDKNLLETVCNNTKNLSYLSSKGYSVSKGFNVILAELLHRLAFYNNFPHEVGLFLGYPLEDVIGFEKFGAANYKYSGIWKVYGEVKSAVRRMNLYKSCTESCMKWLYEGLSVPSAAKKYTVTCTEEAKK